MSSLHIDLKLMCSTIPHPMVKYFSRSIPGKFPHILQGTVNLNTIWTGNSHTILKDDNKSKHKTVHPPYVVPISMYSVRWAGVERKDYNMLQRSMHVQHTLQQRKD